MIEEYAVGRFTPSELRAFGELLSLLVPDQV